MIDNEDRHGVPDDLFFFVIYKKDTNALTVIDMQFNVSYEREDFPVVNNETFTELSAAISYAKKLAAQEGFEYEPFRSRYSSALNEMMDLKLIADD